MSDQLNNKGKDVNPDIIGGVERRVQSWEHYSNPLIRIHDNLRRMGLDFSRALESMQTNAMQCNPSSNSNHKLLFFNRFL